MSTRFTSLRSMNLLLMKMDFYVVELRVGVVETFEGMSYNGSQDVLLEIMKTHTYNSCCMNSFGHMKVRACYLVMKLETFLVSFLLRLDLLQNFNSSLGITKLSKEFMIHCCQLTVVFIERLAYHVKATPSSDCVNSCNNNASLGALGHFSLALIAI